MAVGIRCADHVTPLYPQKLALTSPTGGGRSVGIVRSRTKATEFSFRSLDGRFKILVVLHSAQCRVHCALCSLRFHSPRIDNVRKGDPVFQGIFSTNKYRQPTRCNNNGLLIIPISSTCFGQLFCPSSGELDCVLQLVV